MQGRNENKSDGEDVIQVEILRSEAELQDVNEDDLQAPQEHGPIRVGGLVEADEREGPEGAEEGRERQESDVGWVGREDVAVESSGRIQACKIESVFVYVYVGEQEPNKSVMVIVIIITSRSLCLPAAALPPLICNRERRMPVYITGVPKMAVAPPPTDIHEATTDKWTSLQMKTKT